MGPEDSAEFVAAVEAYERAQLSELAFEPRHLGAFVRAVHAGLVGDGYVRRGKTLVWEGPNGQVGELRLHSPHRFSPTPAAVEIQMQVLQRLCPGEGRVPDRGQHTVLGESFRPTRPMTALYWSPEANEAQFALVSPGAPGQDELVAGVVGFGRGWAQALMDTELFVSRMAAVRFGSSMLTVQQYRRLRALTAGGDLSLLQAAYEAFQARIPPNPWGAWGATLAEVVDAATSAADDAASPS